MNWQGKQFEKKKLLKLYENSNQGYPSPCYWHKGRLIRIYMNSDYVKCLKKSYNKSFRRKQEIGGKGNIYKKVCGNAQSNGW